MKLSKQDKKNIIIDSDNGMPTSDLIDVYSPLKASEIKKVVVKNRQKHVKKLIKLGRSVAQIATELNTSARTVGRDLEKLGLKAINGKQGTKISGDNSAPLTVKEINSVVTKEVEEDDINFMITSDTIMIQSSPEDIDIITKANENFYLIEEALQEGLWATAISLINPKKAIKELIGSSVSINEEGVATYVNEYGETINITSFNIISDIIRLMQIGDEEKSESAIKFLDRLMLNPSNNVVERIYSFCSANDITIDEDGLIVAYKVVTSDYKDCHTRTFDNSVGSIVSIPRNMVDEDQDQTCSYGLHVCSKGYISFFSGGDTRVIRVLVDPADIVAIPEDYNDSKVRCSEYYVLDDVTEAYKDNRI